jgi:mRNA-degrading endonuclease RelE of RelBE toxin-antitoxin system
MTFSFTQKYLKRLRRLPQHVQQRAIKSLGLLEKDPRHPSLHFKEVKPRVGGWSMRVSQDYRMIGYREGEHVTWFWIGSHADYDALLARLD